MESLSRSRRSSVSSAADSDISQMENEIMTKSGIEIIKNAGDKKAPAPSSQTPEAPKRPEEQSAAKFVSGVEEDLTVEGPVTSAAEQEAKEVAELDELMQEKFDETLERREGFEENDEDENSEEEKLESLDTLLGAKKPTPAQEEQPAEADQEEETQ